MSAKERPPKSLATRPRRPVPVSNRILGRSGSRPGPASVRSARGRFTFSRASVVSHRRLLATVSAASAHPTGWHGGFPTGRPWDFALEPQSRPEFSVRPATPEPVMPPIPSDRSDQLAPGPLFLGSDALRLGDSFSARRGTWSHSRYRPAQASWVRRPRSRGVSHPAVRGATCGDINPDRLVGAFTRR